MSKEYFDVIQTRWYVSDDDYLDMLGSGECVNSTNVCHHNMSMANWSYKYELPLSKLLELESKFTKAEFPVDFDDAIKQATNYAADNTVKMDECHGSGVWDTFVTGRCKEEDEALQGAKEIVQKFQQLKSAQAEYIAKYFQGEWSIEKSSNYLQNYKGSEWRLYVKNVLKKYPDLKQENSKYIRPVRLAKLNLEPPIYKSQNDDVGRTLKLNSSTIGEVVQQKNDTSSNSCGMTNNCSIM